MKKLILILTLLIISIACSKPKVKTKEKAEKAVAKEYNIEKISDISYKVLGQDIEINWELTGKQYVEAIEVYEVKENGRNKIGEKDINDAKVFKDKLPLFSKKTYEINLKYINGEKSKSQQITASAEIKNIVKDNIMGREVQVYLPNDYKKSKKYDVIYIFGTESVFDESKPDSWNVRKILDTYPKDVVAVAILPLENRRKNYEKLIPFEDKHTKDHYKISVSKANEFSEFISNKFINIFEKKYFIQNIAQENRMAIGYKESGLYLLWDIHKQNSFGNIAILSGELWPNRNEIKKIYENESKKNVKIYLDTDTKEWSHYSERRFIDTLMKKNYKYGEEIFYREFSDVRMEKRVQNALKILNDEEKKEQSLHIELETIGYKNLLGCGTEFIINPVVKTENSGEFSTYRLANYSVLNSRYGEVDFEGNFKFIREGDIIVEVSYKEFEKKITIQYEELKQYIKKEENICME